MDRSPQMIIGMLAILKADSAYLPLDPAYPENRLIFMLEQQDENIIRDETLGWKKYVTGSIHISCIPGDHETIFKELRAAVQKALSEHGDSMKDDMLLDALPDF